VGNLEAILDTSMTWLAVSCCGNPDFPRTMPETANVPQGRKVFGLSIAGDREVSSRELPTGPPCANCPPHAAAFGNEPWRYPTALHMDYWRKLLARQFCWWAVKKGT